MIHHVVVDASVASTIRTQSIKEKEQTQVGSESG